MIQGYNIFAGFVVGVVMGVLLAVFIGSLNNLIDYRTYQLCRHYNQDVARCVEEIGYERRLPRADTPIDQR